MRLISVVVVEVVVVVGEFVCDSLLTLQRVQKTQNRIEVRPVYCVCVLVLVCDERRETRCRTIRTMTNRS